MAVEPRSIVLLAALLVACEGRGQDGAPRPSIAPGQNVRASNSVAAPRGNLRPVARSPVDGGAQAVTWSADGNTVYIGSTQAGILRWAPSSDPSPQPWLETGVEIDTLARNPEGTRLAWAGDTVSALVDLPNGTPLHRFEHRDLIAALSVDAERMLAIDMRDTARTYDFAAARVLPDRECNTLHALSVAGTADGALMVTGGYGSIDVVGPGVRFTVEMPRCRDAPSDPACVHWTLTRIEEFGDEGSAPTTHVEEQPDWEIHAVDLAPSRQSFAAARADGAVLIVSIEDRRVVRRFETDPEGALSVTHSPDGRRIAVGGRSGRLDVIDRDDGSLYTASTHVHGIVDLDFASADRLATAGFDGVVIWSLAP